MPPLFKKGFTLIELLVVISIIGLLASVIFASLTTARAKGRDAKRLSDLRNLQTAVELYASDNSGHYPSTSNNWWGVTSGFGSHGTSGASGWVPNLAPTYVAVLPTDPKMVGDASYLYNSNGIDYMLLTWNTMETYTPSNNPRPRPSWPNEPSFAFYTPGASGW